MNDTIRQQLIKFFNDLGWNGRTRVIRAFKNATTFQEAYYGVQSAAYDVRERKGWGDEGEAELVEEYVEKLKPILGFDISEKADEEWMVKFEAQKQK